ncbi:MAG: decarboxylating 6-phosphogluconate dehydrogenase [Chloroflexi bacterium]|nr:decarboxylating 6-phosphogluconate dehydrogenase [Chloroflexota bacterium]
MQLGMVGLGKMGGNMARRLIRGGHEVIGYDPRKEAVDALIEENGEGAYTLEELVEKLEVPRSVWIMVPAGEITRDTIASLKDLMRSGDTLIDGGNSLYKESIVHAEGLAEGGIHFIDVGTSGGIWGLAEGYSMMVGGEAEVVERHRSLFEVLAPGADQGWGHVGPAGAGHFVKMIHNGIEYGMMQAYAEGFAILRAKKDFGLDLHQIAEVWRYGSVVRSWLLDLTARALEDDQELSDIKGYVPDSGEGRWTVFESIDLDVPAPIITLSLQQRFRSRIEEAYVDKMLAALRNQFGGHAVKRKSSEG